MKDPSKKIKSESIEENSFLKKRIQELERSEIEHKLAEEELRFSRQQLRLLIDSGQDFFFLKDLDLRYQLVNIANAGFFGLDEADILGRTDFELMPDEAAVACQQSDRQAIREKRLIVMIEQVGDKFYETHKFPVIAAEEVVGVAGIIRDITDRKLAEEAIKERERLFNLTLDDMQTFVALLKPDGEIIFVNNTPLKIIGKTVEQVKGVKFYDVDWWMHSKGIQQIIKEDLRRCASGEKISCEVQIWTLDGYIWIDFSVHPIFGENGSVLYIIPEGRDITKRKQAENGLQQSEQKYRSIVENAVEGIFQSTPEGRFKTVNPAMAHMHGFASPEEMISDITHIGEQLYVNPEDRARYMKMQDEEGIVQGFETQQYRKDGSIIWASINARAVRDPTGKVLYFEGTVEDITSRKAAEDKLKESGAQLKALYQGSPIPTFTWQKKGETFQLVDYNQAAKVATKKEVIKHLGKDVDEIYQNRPEILENMRRCFAEKEVIQREFESRYFMPDRTVLVTFAFVPPDLLMFHVQDITERKLAEKALRESEERLRTIVEASLDAIIAVNTGGRLVLFNGAAQELFQYSEEEALNQPADILLREEIGKIHQERLERFLIRGVGRCGHIGRRTEKFFRRKDGSLFEAEVSMSGGRLDGLRLVVLAIHDITSRKQAEETLRRAEKNFRLSLDESPLGVRIVTIEGETIYANRAMLNIYRYDSIEELRTTPLKERYTPGSYAEFQTRKVKRLLCENDPFEYEVSIVRKNGEVRDLQVFRKEIFWNGERQFQTICQDITARKQVEEALRESEANYRNLFENANEAIFVAQDGKIVFSIRGPP